MTVSQNALRGLMRNIEFEEGVTLQIVLRDVLTDLKHIARDRSLDFDLALDGADEVFLEETQDAIVP